MAQRNTPVEVAAKPRNRTTTPAVTRISVAASDSDILLALLEGRAVGGAALYDRYQRQVRRVLIRLLGDGADIDDLVQETFITAIRTISRIQAPEVLRAWVTSIAVFTARDELKRRWRRRFFRLTAHKELPDVVAVVAAPEIHRALRATYAILERLPADERIAFSLRFIEGMELTEVASACRVSLATIKRRLTRGRRRFEKLAARTRQLADWVARGET